MAANSFIDKLSSELNPILTKDLVEEYRTIKGSHFLQDHEKVMVSGGKFSETVFQILEYIRSGEIVEKPQMDEIMKKLKELPSEKFQDSIRLIMPMAAKTIYGIRSKRGAAHKRREISPNLMDSSFIAATCDWILSEFVRLYYTADQDEIVSVIETLNEREIPLVEEIDGDFIVLKTDLALYEEILLLLYRLFPRRVLYGDLRKWVKRCSQPAFSMALRKCENERLVHRNEAGFRLTSNGTRHVETKLLSKRL